MFEIVGRIFSKVTLPFNFCPNLILFGKGILCHSRGVGFRADMDALPVPETIALPYGSVQPNVAHKCGHDGHAAAALGLTVADMPEPWRPSEDFGWYTQVRPGAMFYVGNGIHWPHQPGFDFNDRILRTITSVFLKLAETR